MKVKYKYYKVTIEIEDYEEEEDNDLNPVWLEVKITNPDIEDDDDEIIANALAEVDFFWCCAEYNTITAEEFAKAKDGTKYHIHLD